MNYIAGIDLGLSVTQKTSGICILDQNAKLVKTEITSSLSKLINIIKKYLCKCIYIDVPLTLPFDEEEGIYKNRLAENLLMRRQNKYCLNPSFAPQSVNMLSSLGERGVILKSRLLNETEVKNVFELHPRSSCEYLNIKYYKHDKPKFFKDFKKLSGIDISNIDNSHVIDAVISAYVGYLDQRGQCIRVGDLHEGAITLPIPRNIKCVFFDMDGTLTNVKSPWQKVFEAKKIWENKGKQLLDQYLSNVFDYKAFCEKDISAWKESNVDRKFIEQTLDSIPLNKNTIYVLKELSKKNIKCIIISTGFYYTAEKIAREAGLKYEEGLNELTPDVLSVFANDVYEKNENLVLRIDVSGDIGHKKGKGAVLKKCLKKLNLSPIRSISIGDSLNSDKELFDLTGDYVFINNEDDLLSLVNKII